MKEENSQELTYAFVDKSLTIAKHLQVVYEALEVAREGLKQMTENPIAVKTLQEIDKITTKVFED